MAPFSSSVGASPAPTALTARPQGPASRLLLGTRGAGDTCQVLLPRGGSAWGFHAWLRTTDASLGAMSRLRVSNRAAWGTLPDGRARGREGPGKALAPVSGGERPRLRTSRSPGGLALLPGTQTPGSSGPRSPALCGAELRSVLQVVSVSVPLRGRIGRRPPLLGVLQPLPWP